MGYPRLTEERVERAGLLVCVLFVGVLLGWCGGTWASIHVLHRDCSERAE